MITYFCRKLTLAERKTKAIYLECLAVREALVLQQHWLIGKQFIVVSDHRPLEAMKVNAGIGEALGELMFFSF